MNIKLTKLIRASVFAVVAILFGFGTFLQAPAEAAAPAVDFRVALHAHRYGIDVSEGLTPLQVRHIVQARKVEKVLNRYEGPLKEYSYDLVVAADKYGIPYNWVAAIGILESGACTHQFNPNNCFGWGKHTQYDSIADGVDHISWNLGGHNPNTAYYYNPELSFKRRVKYYNSVNPTYYRKLTKMMSKMDQATFE